MSSENDGYEPPARDPRYDGLTSEDDRRGRGSRRAEKASGGSERASRGLRDVIEFLIMLIIAVLIALGLRTWVVQTYMIPSASMEDTLQIGDRIFSEKITYYQRTPQQGEVVTFDSPISPGETFIKRVIATEGQTVDLIDGKVYVDGVMLDEPYTEGKESLPKTQTYQNMTITYPYTVPDGMLWVMGDNRTNSDDSRYFGPIEASSVSGRAFYIYWPTSDMKSI